MTEIIPEDPIPGANIPEEIPEEPENFPEFYMSQLDLNSFKLDGVSSLDYGIMMASPPKIQSANRDVQKLEIPGHDGDIIFDNGRYENVSLEFDCILSTVDAYVNDDSIWAAASRAATFLAAGAGYKKITTSYDLSVYQYGRVSSGIKFEFIGTKLARFTVKFDCKPQKYLLFESTAYPTNGGGIYNQHMPSKPLIEVVGVGDCKLTIGAFTVQLYGIENAIYLDCELKDAYVLRPDGTKANANNKIRAADFPILQPGTNIVSWVGDGIRMVIITPRWWRL